jgi:hypothetical protein
MGTRHPWKRRIFIDTEFTNLTTPRLISLALVAEDGAEFYGELSDFDARECSEFVKEKVLPQLGQYPLQIMSRTELSGAVQRWMARIREMKERPVLCYDYPTDVDLLFALIGARPIGWQTERINLRIDITALEGYFAEHGGRHHALHDARANRVACR